MPNNLFRDVPTLMELNPRHNIDFFESSNTSYSVTSIGVNITTLNSFQYYASCLGTNGRIYCLPLGGNIILEIDPIKKTVEQFTISYTGSWGSAVLAPDGKIYGIPASSYNNVLVLDPVTKASYIITFRPFNTSDASNKGILAPDGNIYVIPNNDTVIRVINPTTRTVSTFGNFTGNNKWSAAILGSNGKIYGIPNTSQTLLEITPGTTPSAVTYPMPVYPNGSLILSGGNPILASNGKIYVNGARGLNNGSYIPIYIIDVNLNITFMSEFRFGIPILAPNSKIYIINRAGPTIVSNPVSQLGVGYTEIDTTTNSITSPIVNTYNFLDSPTGGGLNGIILAPNGKIYLISSNNPSSGARYITEFTYGCAHKPALSLLGPYRNF